MTAELAGVPVQFEVDTGAGCSILSKTNYYYSLWGKPKRPKLLPYGGIVPLRIYSLSFEIYL